MIVDTMLQPTASSNYYVVSPHEGRKWQRATGDVELVGKDIVGYETEFRKEFKPKSIIGVAIPSGKDFDEVVPGWYLRRVMNSLKTIIAMYEVEEILEDTFMKVKKLNDVDVPEKIPLPHHYQEKSTYQATKQKYPIAMGGLEFLKVQNEIAWLRNFKLIPRMRIEVRVQIADLPSESFGPYFRLLFSPTDSVTNDTVEFSYDSSKGYLLRQIVLREVNVGQEEQIQRLQKGTHERRNPTHHSIRRYCLLPTIDWLLIGWNQIYAENIEVFIQTKGLSLNYLGIDKYINGLSFSHIEFDELGSAEEHIANLTRIRPKLYGKAER